RKYEDAKAKVLSIIDKYQVEMIAIGNGTASRESEEFIVDVLQNVKREVFYIIVNEAGASVYSASDLAREEFPDLQVEERSAVSIGRRLQDPLAELVKIDPKSVGVGQYQHDVSQKRLNESLTFVVETAVNQVGVNVNTASVALLQYVSGLSKTVAKNIVAKREEEGKFTKRTDLKKIPVRSNGFAPSNIRKKPIHCSYVFAPRRGIYPEQYKNVELLLKSLGLSKDDVGQPQLQKSLEEVEISKLSQETGVGEPTLVDIIDALISPERDMRDELPKPLLKKGIFKIEDLKGWKSNRLNSRHQA
ncbi:helix-hairpin-helix domain-containing protein, partial [Bacillus sp. B-TM1]